MRFNISAQKEFFEDPGYPMLDKMFAAAGAVITVAASDDTNPEFDYQTNPILMGADINQYAFSEGRFHHIGSSTVTIEIDHVDGVVPGYADDRLLCRMVVALTYSMILQRRKTLSMPNCWSKQHGSKRDETGWYDKIPTNKQVERVTWALQQFAGDQMAVGEVMRRLREVFSD